MAAYSLFGTRTVNAFFAIRAEGAKAIASGRRDEFYDMAPNGKFGVPKSETWARAFRSPKRTIAGNVKRWGRALGLNITADSPADVEQKARDLVRRAVSQSNPVLHMAHAFNEACVSVGPSIGGWEKRNPALALLMNAEMWIDDAVETAEQWRLASRAPMIPDVSPESMIKLEREKSG